MDLHLTDAQATTEERAAVDLELGVPQSGRQDCGQQTVDTRDTCDAADHVSRHLRPVDAFNGFAKNQHSKTSLPLIHADQKEPKVFTIRGIRVDPR